MNFSLHKSTKKLSAVLLFTVSIYACRKDVVDKTRADNEVWLQNYAFVPSVLAVKAGTTITWINKDNDDHTVTSDTAGLFSSPILHGGDVFTYTFSHPGAYPYICLFHAPNMAATIIVQ